MRFINSRAALFLMIVLVMLNIGSCSDPDLFSEFTDPRDNKTYRVMNVNGLLWFAEDLRFNDGEGNSYQQGLNACPPGWSLPTVDDWVALNTYFGGYIYNGQSIGDPGKAYNRMIEEFGAEEENYYWTSTPAWDDAASIRSSLFYFNSYKKAIEYGATLISFRMRCRCVNRDPPQDMLDIIQYTANDQLQTFDSYRIDHKNAAGALAVFLHQKLDVNVTINRVNFRFDLPASFINEQSPPVVAANVNFEYQISGLDPWSMTGYHAEADNFAVLITFYDGSTIRGTFSGLTFDGTSIQNGTFELKVTP